MQTIDADLADRNRQLMDRYVVDHDITCIAEDAVFRVMATGDEYRGREAIQGMFAHFYGGGAFEAGYEQRGMMVDGERASVEADLIGRHTGEFAGVPATGKEVRVPFAVHYDLADGLIVAGRVYFEVPVFLAQVGALPA